MPTLNEILAQDDRFRRMLLGLPEEEPEQALGAPVPAAMPAVNAPTPTVTGPGGTLEAPEAAAGGPVAELEPMEFTLPATDPDSDFEPEALPVAPEPDPDAETVYEAPDVPQDRLDAVYEAAPTPEVPAPRRGSDLLGDLSANAPAASEAIYRAFLRQPLDEKYFARQDPAASKASGKPNPLDLLKFLASRKDRKFDEKHKSDMLEALKTYRTDTLGLREDDLERKKEGDKDRKALADARLRLGVVRAHLDVAKARNFNWQTANKFLVDYGKQVASLDPLVASLKEVERLAPGLTHGTLEDNVGESALGSVAKFMNGRYAFGLGERILPEDVTKLRTAVNYFMTQLRHKYYGSALTGIENADWLRMGQQAILAGPQGMASFLDVARHAVYDELAAKESVYQNVPESAWATAAAGGASTTRHPIFSDLRGAPGEATPTGMEDYDPYGGVEAELNDVTNPEPAPRTTVVAPPTRVPAPPAPAPSRRSKPVAPGDRGLKINVPVTDPGGEKVDPYTATAQPSGDGYRRVYEPSANRTAVIAADGTLVDYEVGDTRKSPQATGRPE